MNFLEPSPTSLDLRFRLLGTPVRIHPTFWLFGALLGWASVGGRLNLLLIFLAAFCFSILIHEMGHALMARVFREPTSIILFAFGGAAMGMYQRLRGWHRVFIALAGPGAGFLLFALVVGSSYGYEQLRTHNPQVFAPETKALIEKFFNSSFIRFTLFMCLFYNIMNLIPIYPLDGGQVVREVCLGISPSRGVQLSLGLSFLVAGLVAVYSLLKWQGRAVPYYPPLDPAFVMFFSGLMALENFVMLQRSRAERRYRDQDSPWRD